MYKIYNSDIITFLNNHKSKGVTQTFYRLVKENVNKMYSSTE